MQMLRLGLCFPFLFVCQALGAANESNREPWPLETNLKATTLSIPAPPEEFSILSTIGGPKLRITSCLMVTVAALKKLALGDWQARIMDKTEYTLKDYPEVSIVVNTPFNRRRRYVEARFVNWAVTVGVYRMIRSKKFELAAFELRWNGDLVGWVHVVNNPVRLYLGNDLDTKNDSLAVAKRADNQGKLPPNSQDNPTVFRAFNATNLLALGDAADDAEDARLTTDFQPEGTQTLGIYDVFVPIMGALSEQAPHPATHRSPGVIDGLTGYAGAVCLLPTLPRRSSPPFLEYRWIIRALARIPQYMLDERRFGDIRMNLEVDGVPIALGALNHLPEDSSTSSPAPTATG